LLRGILQRRIPEHHAWDQSLGGLTNRCLHYLAEIVRDAYRDSIGFGELNHLSIADDAGNTRRLGLLQRALTSTNEAGAMAIGRTSTKTGKGGPSVVNRIRKDD